MMNFKQLQEEFRKLEAEAGEKTADALVSLMELRATQFEKDLHQFEKRFEKRFERESRRMQWMLTIGLSIVSILMVLLKIF